MRKANVILTCIQLWAGGVIILQTASKRGNMTSQKVFCQPCRNVLSLIFFCYRKTKM